MYSSDRTLSSRGPRSTTHQPTPPARTTRIAPELIEQIISHLHGDRHTLGKCALVSKSWLPKARYLLFHSLPLCAKSVIGFTDIVTEPSNTIESYITNLDLGSHYVLWPQAQTDELARALWHLAALRGIAALSLARTAWEHLGPSVRTALLSVAANLTTYNLSYVDFRAFGELPAFLRAAHRLKRLSLFKVGWDAWDCDSIDSAPRTFEELEMCFCKSEAVYQWLLTCRVFPPLKSVTLYRTTSINTPSIVKFMHKIGPRLERLQLDSSFFKINGRTLAELHFDTDPNFLIALSNLRYLHIADIYPAQHPSWVPALLIQLNSDLINEIEFSLAVHTIRDLDGFPFGEIDEMLGKTRKFDSMQVVRFYVAGAVVGDNSGAGAGRRDGKEAVEAVVRKRMEACERKKMVRISWGGCSEYHPRDRKDGVCW